MSTTRHDVTFHSDGLAVAGHLYIPDGDGDHRRPAILVGHPMGAVKEQSPAIYAERLAADGLDTWALPGN